MNITDEALNELLKKSYKKVRLIRLSLTPKKQFVPKYIKDPDKPTHGHLNRTFEQVICPYCSKEGSAHIMQRWHFDNCKSKKKC